MQYDELVSIIDKGILDLNLYMEGNSVLDAEKTPIHQSFSDQCGQFLVSAVSERQGDGDSRIHWIPMSALKSYIDIQLNGGENKDKVYLMQLLLNQHKNKDLK